MNIAVMGLGKIAQKSVLPAFKGAQKSRLVMVGSRSGKKAESCAHKYACRAGSYEEVLDDTHVEAVYIALPNHLHFKWGKRVLESGKHLLCEKPLALTRHEARVLVDTANSKSCLVMEAFMYRFHPQHAEVRRRIALGEIGELRAFEASFSYSLDDLSNIRLQKECGGGALFDVGCYGVDSARFIIGAEPVSGVCFSRLGEKSGVDEVSTLQLLFPNGVQASIRCGTDLPRENQYRIIGSKGSIEVPQAFIPLSNKGSVIKVCRERQEIVKIPPINQYSAELDYFCAAAQGHVVDKSLAGQGVENAHILESLAATTGLVTF